MSKLEQYKIETKEDSEKEEVNYYDEQGNKIGTVDRKEGIQKGLLLEAVQLWIIDPDTKQILVQKRSKQKSIDSGKIDSSCNGHVRSYEIPEQAVLREAFEEIGVNPLEVYQNMKKIMTVTVDLTKVGGKGDYIAHEYITFLKHPISYYKLQKEEVEEIFFMDYETLRKETLKENSNMRMPNTKEAEEFFDLLGKELENQIAQEKCIDK